MLLWLLSVYSVMCSLFDFFSRYAVIFPLLSYVLYIFPDFDFFCFSSAACLSSSGVVSCSLLLASFLFFSCLLEIFLKIFLILSFLFWRLCSAYCNLLLRRVACVVCCEGLFFVLFIVASCLMAVPLKNIKKYIFYPLIQARVCRVWMPMQNGQTSSFNCLLVDHQGGAIQASSKARDAALFKVNITEGRYIEIKNFYTYENRATNIVVDHEAIIDLKSDTKIVHLDSVKHEVPRYHFHLTDFAHVLTKGRGSRILTDVLGRLKAIQPIEKILVQGHRLEDKKEFIIENIRGEDLRVTLWGDIARSFDDNVVNAQESPIIIVFAGFRVTEFRGAANLTGTAASLWYFNPDIPEVLPYKQFYSQMPLDVHTLPPSLNAVISLDQQINENRKTIKEILCMDPYQHKNMRFTCIASITDYDLFNGWWCKTCPKCTKTLSGPSDNLRCFEHGIPDSAPIPWFKVNCIVTDGKDVTNFFLSGKTAESFFNTSAHHLVYDKKFVDPYVVPPQMTQALNKMKIFQLRFGAYKSAVNRCDIFVTNVFDESIRQSSVIQSEQFGAESSITPTTMIIENSSVVQADTLTLLTPPDCTPPSQHQQDIYHAKAKKVLDFTETHLENRHLKQKSIILDEEDETPTKRNKYTLSPSSEED